MVKNQYGAVDTEIFISRAKAKHGNKYDYSKVEYTNNNTKVAIICEKHGVFYQLPPNHYKGGCRKCAKELTSRVKVDRIDTKKFIERAKNLYGDAYDYTLTEYTTPWKKVLVRCSLHGLFKTNYLHLKGVGCPLCGIARAVETRISNGYALSPDVRTDYNLFEHRVNRITEYNYRKHAHLINPNNYPRSRVTGWHLDHKFSKKQGFIEGIPPEIIGHWTNLQMLTDFCNRSKQSKCSITKDELMTRYTNTKTNKINPIK